MCGTGMPQGPVVLPDASIYADKWPNDIEDIRRMIRRAQRDALEVAARECEEYSASRFERDDKAGMAAAVDCARFIRKSIPLPEAS